MRIRSLKPEFWRSQDISSLAIEDRLLFVGLWSYVDDNGVGRDRLAEIAADLFADDLERDSSETFARVSRGLQHLSDGSLIVRYEAAGRRLIHITNWEKHQRVDRPNKSRYPLPSLDVTRGNMDPRDDDATPSREDRDTPSPGTEEQGNRGTEERTTSVAAQDAAPTKKRGTRLPADWRPSPAVVDAIRDECPTVDLAAEHRKFTDYWLGKSGASATKLDWDATWRNWIRTAAERRGGRSTGPGRRGDIDWDAALARAAARDGNRGAA